MQSSAEKSLFSAGGTHKIRSDLAMTRHFSRFQGLSRAASGRKESVPMNVGHSALDFRASSSRALRLLAGYCSYSAVGPMRGAIDPLNRWVNSGVMGARQMAIWIGDFSSARWSIGKSIEAIHRQGWLAAITSIATRIVTLIVILLIRELFY
jgi:hypothetical protein